MSYTTLYKVPESGSVEDVAEFKNSHLGAMIVWSQMAELYLGMKDYSYMHDDAKMRQVWDLWKSPDVPMSDRIVMASTFDRVMVKRENLPRLIEAIYDFARRFRSGHLLDQAQVMKTLADDPTCYAICWQQTSVSDSLWFVQDTEKKDEYGDPLWRGYDLSKDSGHWFLFDELATVEA